MLRTAQEILKTMRVAFTNASNKRRKTALEKRAISIPLSESKRLPPQDKWSVEQVQACGGLLLGLLAPVVLKKGPLCRPDNVPMVIRPRRHRHRCRHRHRRP